MKRHYAKREDLSSKAKSLPKLIPGDQVYVQDQTGKTPRQWNKSGTVLEVHPNDSYLISIDGSFQTTRRNRKFLWKFTPYNTANVPTPPPSDVQLPVIDNDSSHRNQNPLPSTNQKQASDTGGQDPRPESQAQVLTTEPCSSKPKHLRER